MADYRQTEHPSSAAAAAAVLQKQLDVEQGRTKSLETELEIEKMKNQGMQMLFDCVQEEHAENRRLKSLLKRRKLMLRKLKKRLLSNPNSDVQMNLDEISDMSDFEDSVELDKRNLESRQESREDKENQIPQSSGQKSSASVDQAEKLKKRVEELLHENEQLTSQLTSSGTDKDAEILKLKKRLCELEKSQKVSGILCDTLSEEAVLLKRHLAETAGMCQKLMRTLEMKKDNIAKLTTMVAEKTSVDVLKSPDDETTLTALKKQHINLELKLKEVVTMNSRWQQYNEQREEYVQQLLQRNVELEQALVNRGQQLTQAQQENIDQLLIEQKQKLELVKEEKASLEREHLQMKSRLENLQLVSKKSELVIRALREKVAKDATEHAKLIHMHLENNETLKLQMQVYREDFESERRDRERARAQIAQLESQIRSATQQLSLNQMHANNEPVRNYDTHPYIRQQSFPQDASLVGRGVPGPSSNEDRQDSGELDLRPSD